MQTTDTPPHSEDGSVSSGRDDEVERTFDAARELLELCSPLQFHPTTLRQWLDDTPALQRPDTRHRMEMAVVQLLSQGYPASPHAIVLLADYFGWKARRTEDSELQDERFQWRLQTALDGSRPSTRQHATPPVRGISIGCLLAYLAYNFGDTFNFGGSPGHPSSTGFGTSADWIAMGTAVTAALIGLGAQFVSMQTSGAPAIGRRTLLVVRVVAALLVLGGIGYCFGRP